MSDNWDQYSPNRQSDYGYLSAGFGGAPTACQQKMDNDENGGSGLHGPRPLSYRVKPQLAADHEPTGAKLSWFRHAGDLPEPLN